MFAWFTEQHADPLGVAALLGLQFLSYAGYAWLVAGATEARSRLSRFTAGLVPLSVALTLSIHWLHFHHRDDLLGWVWLVTVGVHFAYPAVAGYSLYPDASNREWCAYAALLVSTYVFLTVLIVVPDTGP